MKTLGYVLQRLFYGLVIVVAVIVLNFLLLSLAPGDIADTLAAQAGGATQEQIAELRRTLGLDAALPVQLWHWYGRMLKGDLGQSIFLRKPVLDAIIDRYDDVIVNAGLAVRKHAVVVA